MGRGGHVSEQCCLLLLGAPGEKAPKTTITTRIGGFGFSDATFARLTNIQYILVAAPQHHSIVSSSFHGCRRASPAPRVIIHELRPSTDLTTPTPNGEQLPKRQRQRASPPHLYARPIKAIVGNASPKRTSFVTHLIHAYGVNKVRVGVRHPMSRQY